MTATPIRDRLDQAEPFKSAPAAPSATPLEVERFRDIKPQLTGLWLIKRLLPAIGQAVVYGHPNCGKSFLAMDMGFHVALGRDWHGRRTKAGLVIYVGAEGLAGLRNRVVAFRRENDVDDMPFSLVPTPIDMQAPDADVKRVIATIEQEAAHYDLPIAMVVLDTLSKTFGAGKENTDDMAIYVSNCGRVAAQFECCVLVVHHRPKDAESEEPRGHSSLKGGVDTVILVEAGSTKSARVTKQRDGELGETMLFKLKSVGLGNDEDGEIVTSCVVQPSEFDDRPKGDPILLAIAKLPDSAKLFFRQLEETIVAVGMPVPTEIPSAEINRLRVGKVVLLEAWSDKAKMAARTGSDTKPDSARKAFDRALLRLQRDGIVRVWGQYAWREFGQSGHARTVASDSPGHSDTFGHTLIEGVRVSEPADHVRGGMERYPHGNPALVPIKGGGESATPITAGSRPKHLRDPFNAEHWPEDDDL
jgi:hypothetical protein